MTFLELTTKYAEVIENIARANKVDEDIAFAMLRATVRLHAGENNQATAKEDCKGSESIENWDEVVADFRLAHIIL